MAKSAPQRDTSIRVYRAKRDFAVTPEPAPAARESPRGAPVFVVQKHAARRAGLHWDLRLEHGGVLWSWAVRKGPSLDPADKRLAAHVEDHPLDYGGFEGTIPAGEYGAGAVEIWDRGTWEPLGDPEQGMRKGDLEFVLHGQRLNGRFHLVRLKRRERERQDAWLLIKGHDEYERPGGDAAALEAAIPLDGTPKRPGEERAESEPPPSSPRPRPGGAIVVARAPKRRATTLGGVELTHAERELWPGITKLALAEYWRAVAPAALPGLVQRPLAVVRHPEGIGGERFFQKRGQGLLPPPIREGEVLGSPYLALDDVDGLIAMAQMSAIEIHPWGAREADPLHPDFIVFDLDPGEGVAWAEVVRAAHEVRERLERLKLGSFCRTTGGKGLHVVVPLTPSPEWDWERVKAFTRAFAELMTEEAPDRYLAHLKLADRSGRVLVDWLRNGMGNTAIASFCPRARPGATVATPLFWDEVTPRLDPAAFTIRTVPERIAAQKRDPWRDFYRTAQKLPELEARDDGRADVRQARGAARKPPESRPRVVVYARKPRPR